MLRTGLAIALVAAAWAASGRRCAAEKAVAPSEARPPAPTEWLHAPPVDSWPAGTLEEESPSPQTALLTTCKDWLSGWAAAPPTRSVGWGNPLTGTSWRNRPWYTGAFFGGMFGDELIANRIDQDVGVVGGWRLGYDFDHYWGGEGRIAFAYSALDETPPVRPARDLQEWYFDGSVLFYPWGDAQWRPYFSVGLGSALVRFDDADGVPYREMLFQVPFGVGIKYFYDRGFAMRADLTHNVVVGAAGLNTRDNVSLTAGFEFRFGARPRSYFPW